MTDEERIAKATRKGSRMIGPTERERCSVHPRRWTTYRWEWDVPTGSETQIDCISNGDAVPLRPCADCEAADD